MLKKLILLVFLFGFVVFSVTPVTAQEMATDSAQQESTTILPTDIATQSAQTTVFSKDRETQRITELRSLYRNQVEVYRNAEKAYVIAKTNFEQVATLASLEEAVKATNLVMQERSRVMITYLELLDAVLNETNGVELNLKAQSSTELIGLITALKIHQDEIFLSSSRESMVILSDSFEPIANSYASTVYKTLSLIRIGQMQEVRDKSEIIMQDIVASHELSDSSNTATAKRKRAYVEIERNFDTVNVNLAKLNSKFLEAKREGFSRSFYENILKDLGPVYVQISKSLEHLEELLTL